MSPVQVSCFLRCLGGREAIVPYATRLLDQAKNSVSFSLIQKYFSNAVLSGCYKICKFWTYISFPTNGIKLSLKLTIVLLSTLFVYSCDLSCHAKIWALLLRDFFLMTSHCFVWNAFALFIPLHYQVHQSFSMRAKQYTFKSIPERCWLWQTNAIHDKKVWPLSRSAHPRFSFIWIKIVWFHQCPGKWIFTTRLFRRS